jgi:hypothetical protein
MEVSMPAFDTTDAKPFDVHAYLRRELKRYFPDSKIDVHEGDERWDIGIRFPTSEFVLSMHMEVGSDDECFRFVTDSGTIFTVPIPPEMGE